jgi:hypothetical protein
VLAVVAVDSVRAVAGGVAVPVMMDALNINAVHTAGVYILFVCSRRCCMGRSKGPEALIQQQQEAVEQVVLGPVCV